MRFARAAGVGAAMLGLLTLLSGCLSLSVGPRAAQGPPAASVLPLSADYAGWTVERDNGIATLQVHGPAADQVRQDAAVLLRSPSGDMRLLASYARSGSDQQGAQAKPWTTLDTLFKGDGWRSDEAQALYRTFSADYPKDSLLGAYQVSASADGVSQWYVGFYRIEGVAGIRGERVYAFDPKSKSWRRVADDSKSQDFWNELVPVP